MLMTHLKEEEGRLEEALEVVIAGLKDEDTHIGKLRYLSPQLCFD